MLEDIAGLWRCSELYVGDLPLKRFFRQSNQELYQIMSSFLICYEVLRWSELVAQLVRVLDDVASDVAAILRAIFFSADPGYSH